MNKISFTSNGKQYSVYIRDDADESVFAEIFKKHEYRIAEDIIRGAKNPIFDIGSHAGFFSIYARSLNNDAEIVAVEPEVNNLSFLKKNLEENNIKSVKIIEGAVASGPGRRHLKIERDSHNHRLLSRKEEKSDNTNIVTTWSLPELMKKCIINQADLVKMDIEGGEYEVFEGVNGDDLAKVKSFIIEYHLKGGKKFEVIENKLRENGFGVRVMPSRFDKKMGFIFATNKRS